MKKLLSILLSLAVVLALCACADNNSVDAPDNSADLSPAVTDSGSTDTPAVHPDPAPSATDTGSTDPGTDSDEVIPFTVTPVQGSPSQTLVTQFVLIYEKELIEFSGHHVMDEFGPIQTYYFDMTGDGVEELVVFLIPGGRSGTVDHEVHIFDGVTLEEYDTSALYTLGCAPYSFTAEGDTYSILAGGEPLTSFTRADVLARWSNYLGHSEFTFADNVFLTGEYVYTAVEDGWLCVHAECMVGSEWLSYGKLTSRFMLEDGALTVVQTSYAPPKDVETLTVRISAPEDDLLLFTNSDGVDVLLYGDSTRPIPWPSDGFTDLRAVDLDGDGEDEIAITGWVASGNSVYSLLHVLDQQSDGTWTSYTFSTDPTMQGAQVLDLSMESAVLTPEGDTVGVELEGLTHTLTVDRNFLAASLDGDYYLSSKGTNRIITWIEDQPYLSLSGKLYRKDSVLPEGYCGTGCELLCRLDYKSLLRFEVVPVSLHSLATVYTPFYEDTGSEMCDIHGYNADALCYIKSTYSLYFASPRFLSDFFNGILTEGSAELAGDLITVSFTRHDNPQSGAVTGAQIQFTVDLGRNVVISTQSESFNGLTIELTNEEKLEIAAGLAQVIRDVEQHLNS